MIGCPLADQILVGSFARAFASPSSSHCSLLSLPQRFLTTWLHRLHLQWLLNFRLRWLSILLSEATALPLTPSVPSRYLAVCTSLEDGTGVAEAHFLLGVVATRVARHATAAGEFEAALAAAKTCGNKEIARYARIRIGMAKGKVNLAQQLVALDGLQQQ